MMGKKGNSLIVAGAGVWGLSCALACARHGWRVTVLEKDRVGAGASGGVVGAMAPHTPDRWTAKKQFQFQALETATLFWEEVEHLSGLPTGYGRIERLQPILTHKARTLALARAVCAQEVWQGRTTWTVEDAPDWIAPVCAPCGVIRDNLSARIHPAKATRALAAACQATGVTITEGVAVHGLSDSGVHTECGDKHADAVILAAGVGGFDLLAPHTARTPGAGQKGQAALLKCDLGTCAQIYADGLYIVPHSDGTVAVGSTSEDIFDHPTATDAQLDALIARAQRQVPALAGAHVLQRWAGLRPKPRKRNPMLGPVPGLDPHFVALGAFKIGFGLAAKVGETLANCLEGTARIPDSFSIEAHTGD